MKNWFFIIAISSVLISSCRKSDEAILEDDIAEILEYLEENDLEAESTASGLYYIIHEEGNGIHPEFSSTVEVNYLGYLPDGTVFDQSPAGGIEFPLFQVIEGWQEGIPLLSEGGSGTLFIPSGLAYGRDGSGSSIGPDQVIFFDVDLLDVSN